MIELGKFLPEVLAAGSVDSTINMYFGAFKRFRIWTQNYHNLSCLPADEKAVILYLVSLAQMGKKPPTIQCFFSALNLMHDINGLERPGDFLRVRTILKGAKKFNACQIQKKQPASVTM